MAKSQSNLQEQTRLSLDQPRMYRVIMHNDDFTTMEFVVMVLKTVFYKSEDEANQLMLSVHKQGQAVVGLYRLDIAASKSQRAMRMAREQGFPFQLTWEPEETDFSF